MTALRLVGGRAGGANADAETIAALQGLLSDARAGRIVGLAFAAIGPGRDYLVDACGEALRDPALARGIVCSLSDELGELVRSGQEAAQ